MHFKAQYLLILALLIVNVPIFSSATPGDTFADAKSAQIGDNMEQLIQYNDVDYYNLTAVTSITYNFTLYNSDGNDMALVVYDGAGTVLASNATFTPARTILLTGEDKYIIGVFASEFSTFPAGYNLIINEADDQSPIIEDSINVNPGCTFNTFTAYNDIHWYNFTANASLTYDITVERNASSYIYLAVYDQDLMLLGSNSSSGPVNLVSVTGQAKYIIGVYSSEFISFPLDYCLFIENQQVVEPLPPISDTISLIKFNGTLEAYNDIHYYNFTASTQRTYKFSLLRNESAWVSLYIYDPDMTLIASNATADLETTLILSGYDFYRIAVVSSEFVIFPLDYIVCVEELVIGDEKDSIALAAVVGTGSYTDTFQAYNDVHWYNFTAMVDHTYRFDVDRSSSAYITLTVYDSDLMSLATNSTTGPINRVELSGEDIYVIAIYSSEFISFPQDYTLSITDITPTDDPTDPETSEPTSEENPDNGLGVDVSFPWISLLAILAIPTLRLIKNKQEN